MRLGHRVARLLHVAQQHLLALVEAVLRHVHLGDVEHQLLVRLLRQGVGRQRLLVGGDGLAVLVLHRVHEREGLLDHGFLVLTARVLAEFLQFQLGIGEFVLADRDEDALHALVGQLAQHAAALARRLARLAGLLQREELLRGRRAGVRQASTKVGPGLLRARRQRRAGQQQDDHDGSDAHHSGSSSRLNSMSWVPLDSTGLPSTSLGLNFHL